MDRNYTCKVKKFNLDDTVDRLEYESLLNQQIYDEIKITREEFTFDKTKGNQAVIVVWWQEYNS